MLRYKLLLCSLPRCRVGQQYGSSRALLAGVEDAGELPEIERAVVAEAGVLDEPGLAAGHVGIADQIVVKRREPRGAKA